MKFNRRQTYTDEELQAHYRKGSGKAFQRIYEKYDKDLLAYIRNYSKDDRDAEDVCIIAFTKLSEKIKNGETVEKILPWLVTAARNRYLDILRSNDRKMNDFWEEVRLEPTQEEGTPAYDFQKDPRWNILIREVTRLKEEQRIVIVARFLHEQSAEEIAQLHQWPVTSVYNYLNGAKKTLRRRCQTL
ncbi:RNA polymerase sigma factor [Lewinella sp. W8]|uniref:RNA polymerase sigma factor n=1 Tax=Lewinella sp. W8 TaxID=2528208 RepID=UPI001068BDEF|nr:sigma-70 family RNA polymerase sigma factor [Lewinella sp. W8]MTB49723.1 sigma-70 family RNA polymerase sigma factor [Lewinella sp. W8]